MILPLPRGAAAEPDREICFFMKKNNRGFAFAGKQLYISGDRV